MSHKIDAGRSHVVQAVLVGELLVMASESAVTVILQDMIELKNLRIKSLITQ